MVRPVPGVVVVTLVGHDAGDLAEKVFSEIEIDLAIQAPLQLFVDAGDASAASMTVSQSWATFLTASASRLGRVVFLASSPLALMTSHFVRARSGLGDRMQVLDDLCAFERALRSSGPFPKVSATWRISSELTPAPEE